MQPVRISSNRSFGLTMSAVFAALAAWPLLQGRSASGWLLATAGAFFAAAVIAPALLKPLNRLWAQFGILLGRFVSPIALTVLFYGVVTPIGLLMRLARKDPLNLRRDAGRSTYWNDRVPPGPAPDSLPRQF